MNRIIRPMPPVKVDIPSRMNDLRFRIFKIHFGRDLLFLFTSSSLVSSPSFSSLKDLFFNGIIIAPKMMQDKQITAKTLLQVFQPSFVTKYLNKGASAKVPNAIPDEAIPDSTCIKILQKMIISF